MALSRWHKATAEKCQWSNHDLRYYYINHLIRVNDLIMTLRYINHLESLFVDNNIIVFGHHLKLHHSYVIQPCTEFQFVPTNYNIIHVKNVGFNRYGRFVRPQGGSPHPARSWGQLRTVEWWLTPGSDLSAHWTSCPTSAGSQPYHDPEKKETRRLKDTCLYIPAGWTQPARLGRRVMYCL